MDTLIREGNPPAGQLASPVPQVWDPTANGGAGGWVRVYGAHNSPRAILYGPNGQPISTANRLPVEATLTGRKVSVVRASYSQAIEVPHGGFVNIDLIPPANELRRVKNLFIRAPLPPGAVSGTQILNVMVGLNDSARDTVINATYPHNVQATIQRNLVTEATLAIPSSEIAQQTAILNLVADLSNPITIQYRNSTGVTVTGTLEIIVCWEVEAIVA